MSLFLQWGAHMPITVYDEDGDVVFDADPLVGNETMALQALWWAPQWLHSNYYKHGAGLPVAANCPLDRAPADCDGFFYRVEFKLPLWADI